MAYLLDADVFIQAKNRHYGLDFCPAFWDWLIAENGAGRVFSVEKVGAEVQAIEDELSEWAHERGDRFFLRPDASVLPALGSVSTWASNQRYESTAVATFLEAADYYLIAQAIAGQHTVVTHETPSPSLKKIKIPNVCIGMNVGCISPFEMLRTERARIVLGQR